MPRRERPLTVYGGMAIHSMPKPYRNQVHAIIAAESGAAARRYADAVGHKITSSMWRDHWSETGNDVSVTVASASPRVLLYQPTNLSIPSGLRGVWLPWSWKWPASSIYGPGSATACSSCGTDIDRCDEMLFEFAHACCSRCRYTDTHNDPMGPAHHERVARAAARVKARADA